MEGGDGEAKRFGEGRSINVKEGARTRTRIAVRKKTWQKKVGRGETQSMGAEMGCLTYRDTGEKKEQ